MKIEEKHKDVLLTIESAVIQHYRNNPNLKDYDVSVVYEALHTHFRRELAGMPQQPLVLNEDRTVLFDTLKILLTVHQEVVATQDVVGGENPNEVYMLCFKRLIKSVKLWTTRGVRGYLDFVKKHV